MSGLSHDDKAVLSAFLKHARGGAADVPFSEIVSTARRPVPDIQRSLKRLRELGYITTLNTYGPGRQLARVSTRGEDT